MQNGVVDRVMGRVQSCVLISFSIKCNILSADVNYYCSFFISMQMSCQELQPYLYHFLLESTKVSHCMEIKDPSMHLRCCVI